MLQKIRERWYKCRECGREGVKSSMLYHICGMKYETATRKAPEREMKQGGIRPSDGSDEQSSIIKRRERTSKS
jgi:hypothetical protein